MALLLENIDTDSIRIIRRWRSDEILSYLHVTLRTFIQVHDVMMVSAGNYTLIPVANCLPSAVRTPAG